MATAKKTTTTSKKAPTKAATKTTVAKKSTSKKTPVAEGKFIAKGLGVTLIVTVEGTKERYSKKMSKEEKAAVIKEMEAYNKRPSATRKKKIIGLLAPEAVKKAAVKEATTAKIKGLKSQVKKIKKTNKKEEKEEKSILVQLEEALTQDATAVDKLQAILDKFKKKDEKVVPVAAVTSSPRGGENYRRY
jgi:hypothetical protein